MKYDILIQRLRLILQISGNFSMLFFFSNLTVSLKINLWACGLFTGLYEIMVLTCGLITRPRKIRVWASGQLTYSPSHLQLYSLWHVGSSWAYIVNICEQVDSPLCLLMFVVDGRLWTTHIPNFKMLWAWAVHIPKPLCLVDSPHANSIILCGPVGLPQSTT